MSAIATLTAVEDRRSLSANPHPKMAVTEIVALRISMAHTKRGGFAAHEPHRPLMKK